MLGNDSQSTPNSRMIIKYNKHYWHAPSLTTIVSQTLTFFETGDLVFGGQIVRFCRQQIRRIARRR